MQSSCMWEMFETGAAYPLTQREPRADAFRIEVFNNFEPPLSHECLGSWQHYTSDRRGHCWAVETPGPGQSPRFLALWYSPFCWVSAAFERQLRCCRTRSTAPVQRRPLIVGILSRQWGPDTGGARRLAKFWCCTFHPHRKALADGGQHACLVTWPRKCAANSTLNLQ